MVWMMNYQLGMRKWLIRSPQLWSMPDFLSIDSASIEEQFPVWFRLYSASEAQEMIIYNKAMHVIVFKTTVHCWYVKLFNELNKFEFPFEMFLWPWLCLVWFMWQWSSDIWANDLNPAIISAQVVGWEMQPYIFILVFFFKTIFILLLFLDNIYLSIFLRQSLSY
jgi:hypothetical protein